MLKIFEEADFTILLNWVTSKELLFRFSAVEFSYPLTLNQWRAYRQKYPDRQQYLAMLDNSTPYGFGEIIPQDENSVRLSRLLVGEAQQRGKGLGRKLIKSLIAESKAEFTVKRVDLFVLEDNHGAIRCYEKAGFQFVKAKNLELEFNGKKYVIKKMSHGID